MTRLLLASIAVVSALAVVPYAGEAQKATANVPKHNQVYVKVILPEDPATGDKDRPVVESWIAEQLNKRGQSKFTAASAWLPLAFTGEEIEEYTDVFPQGGWGGCPTGGQIVERADGRIKVRVDGWAPVPGFEAIASLTDEPGSRAVAAVQRRGKTQEGLPFVAVLIGPPLEKPAAPADQKK